MPKKIVDIFPPQKIREYREPLRKEEIQIEKEITTPGHQRKKSGWKLLLLFLVLMLLAGGFFVLNFVLAKVEITIWPKINNLNFEEEITADTKAKQIDFQGKIVPAKIFEEDKITSKQFPASGKILKEENAKGVIKVYNNYTAPQTLVANTRFQPPAEKILYFRSTKSVVVPAKGSLDVEVKADRPGEDYNIGPSTFSLPGLAGLPQYYSVYGKSFSPMTGGVKKEVLQVSQSDLDSAKKSLTENLAGENKDYLRSKIPANYVLLDAAISQEIITASSSVSVGSEAETFNFYIKSHLKVISFSQTDVENFADSLIEAGSKNGEKIQPDSKKLDYSVESIDKTAGKISLKLNISANNYLDINLDSLKKSIAGKPLKEVRTLLGDQSNIKKIQIKVFPMWLKDNPLQEDKVNIKLNIIS
jgi:hypothetical protein